MNEGNDLLVDRPLSVEQQKFVSELSLEDIQKIDETLLLNTSLHWRKVAMIIGSTMVVGFKNEYQNIPDIYFSQRIAYLVKMGKLESQGDLRRMRYSEVRKIN